MMVWVINIGYGLSSVPVGVAKDLATAKAAARRLLRGDAMTPTVHFHWRENGFVVATTQVYKAPTGLDFVELREVEYL